MALYQLVIAQPWIFWTLAGCLGLMVGSFLNVVCLRLPKMMEREWRQQCCELLELPSSQTTADDGQQARFNLAYPPSHCPNCGHTIRAWENIPLVSYLLILRGRCSGCQQPISPRYPVVEAISGVLSLLVAMHFGVSWSCLAALLLTWTLLTLSVIDIDTQLLPDDITLPLLWAGLLLNSAGVFTNLQSAVFGAAGGYLALWSVYWLFKLATGKEGMGYGDFKLLAALGAWLGWQALAEIILLSSLVGAVAGMTMILLRGRDRQLPIPFGPYLAAAGWIALLWGTDITRWYFNLSGIPG